MRITIIPDDQTVILDGQFIKINDMPSIGSTIHAVQWNNGRGTIEHKDSNITDQIVATHLEEITDISQFQEIIDLATLELEQQALAQEELAQSRVLTTDMIKEQVRNHRDFRLLQSDWTQLSDNVLSEAQRAQWKTYRQQLRDITNQPNFPTDVIWPEKP